MILKLTSGRQLDLVEGDIRKGVERILKGADPHGLRTVDDVLVELRRDVDNGSAGVWVDAPRGRVRALLSARVYISDQAERLCAITWAFGAPGAEARTLMEHCEAWALEQRCVRMVASRAFGTGLRSFTRLLRRYGLSPDFVVYSRTLVEGTHEHSQRSAGRQTGIDDGEHESVGHGAAQAR